MTIRQDRDFFGGGEQEGRRDERKQKLGVEGREDKGRRRRRVR